MVAEASGLRRAQVLECPTNPWSVLSPAVWSALRQPLCLVILRSASGRAAPATVINAADTAFEQAPRLFAAVLTRTPLRHSLKAELGAFFPLLLHQPLDDDATPPALLAACLEASMALAADAQLVVDLFLNYDCDLQACNVVERWENGLRRTALSPEPARNGAGGAAAGGVRGAAVACMCTQLRALDGWLRGLHETRTAREMSIEDRASDASPQPELDFEVRCSASPAINAKVVSPSELLPSCLRLLLRCKCARQLLWWFKGASVPTVYCARSLPGTMHHSQAMLPLWCKARQSAFVLPPPVCCAGSEGHEGQACGGRDAIRAPAPPRPPPAARRWLRRRDR
jgi:Guanine nucleotide exchange factor in Golgi transport N-terminal